MLRKAVFLAGWLASAGTSTVVIAQETAPFGGIPSGKGQVEVFAFCSACHSMMIVKQQRLSRDDWEETLEWMVDEQGMDPLPEAIQPMVLDYLAEHFGESAP